MCSNSMFGNPPSQPCVISSFAQAKGEALSCHKSHAREMLRASSSTKVGGRVGKFLHAHVGRNKACVVEVTCNPGWMGGVVVAVAFVAMSLNPPSSPV